MVNNFMASRYFPQLLIIIIDSTIVLALINNKCNWKVDSSNITISTTVQKVESSDANNY